MKHIADLLGQTDFGFDLPTVVTAYDLGRKAAQDRYGRDCNPWRHNDKDAQAQRDAWDRGYVAYSVLS